MLNEKIISLKYKLDDCSERKIDEISDEDYLDIENLNLNENSNMQDRAMLYIKNAKNPYAIKTKNVKILIKFKNDGLNINDCLLNIINARVQ